MALSNPTDDPRVRFAAERTLLAWVRTGLALMGFGFVVARFGLFLHETAAVRPDLPARHGTASVGFGTALVLLGVLVTAYAAVDHCRVQGRLDRGEPISGSRAWAGVTLALLLALLGLFVAGYLALVAE